MQKKAMFWYCAHGSGSANKKYTMCNMGNNITHTTNCNYRIDGNNVYHINMVCSWYTIMNTLHKQR